MRLFCTYGNTKNIILTENNYPKTSFRESVEHGETCIQAYSKKSFKYQSDLEQGLAG